ncbi:MAG: phasin family protein [Lysobacterales bacterium]
MGEFVPSSHKFHHRLSSSVFTLIIEPTIRPSIFNPHWSKEFEMVTKTLKKKVPAKKAKSGFATPVADSVKEFWFAGLGAFSVVQQESEKLIGQGTKLFDNLVSEGARVEKESLDLVDSTVDELKTDVEKKLEDVRHQANESWDNLGSIFDERVSGTLERLGIPTTKDLNRLSGRLQSISSKTTNSWKGLEKVARGAADNLGKLESEFSKRVKDILESLHVPGMEDLDKLSENVQKVSRDSVESVGKLEAKVEKRVSDTFAKLEATTTGEIKKLNDGVQDVSRQVSENWGKLESVVEERVKVVLGGLGIPSSDDISKLATELKKLSSQVAALDKKLNAKAKVAPKKPAAKKALTPKTATTMTVAEKKKAAEAISKMKPANKPETKS